MPFQPGHAKIGGRTKGSPISKRAQALERAVARAHKRPDQLPLEFLLAVMSNKNHPMTVRIDAAKAAAPYVHFRKGYVDSAGRDVPITVQVIRFGDEPPIPPKLIEHDPDEPGLEAAD